MADGPAVLVGRRRTHSASPIPRTVAEQLKTQSCGPILPTSLDTKPGSEILGKRKEAAPLERRPKGSRETLFFRGRHRHNE